MQASHEERLLQKLITTGQLSPQQLAKLQTTLETWGPRLGALLASGQLSPGLVTTLAGTASTGDTPMPGPFDHPTPDHSSGARAGTLSGPAPRRGPGSRAGMHLGHYEVGEVLGRGGMGEVYRARDTVLDRTVAVKFLFSEDPEQASRFLQEARLQARVHHEHVCQVHEAGELDGAPYIVMQLIQGLTLARAQLVMTREQKVRVMEQVAEAVHLAHTQGCIHRDIKPSNIMVELTQSGEWRPYVMDFGLARDVAAHGATLTAQPMGTPAYMAPEQALGLKGLQKEQTDVYGLGGTLYFLLAGHPPVEGDNPLQLLRSVVDSEPEPLRRTDPSIPRDLETIVMKCLEKEPARRYQSAQALADDLHRYLEGEPISARGTSVPYRLWRFARKNRPLVVVATTALAAMMVLGGLSVRSSLHAAERARLAQAFGQDVERIDAVMRTAYLLPEHDIRADKMRVVATMARIEAQLEAVGRAAEGPAHYALGRGCMALGRYQDAREHLEKAWAEGVTSSEASSALGLTLGQLYKECLDEIARLADTNQREQRRKQIEVELRTPAVALLRAAMGELPREYGEGLIALFERRHGVALEHARTAFAQDGTLYQARLLEGDALAGLAEEKRRRGEATAALEELGRARQAFEAAATIARSDPTCQTSLADLWLQTARVGFATGSSPLDDIQQGLAAVTAAARIDPDRAETHTTRAKLATLLAQYQLAHGEDPSAALDDANASAARALQQRPGWSEPASLAATALHLQALYRLATGRDPREALTSAVGAYTTVLQMDPQNPVVLSNLGGAEIALGQYLRDHGEDPRPTYAAARRHLAQASEMQPDDAAALSNLGGVLQVIGEYEAQHGGDPREALTEAVPILARAISAKPDDAASLANLGVVHLSLAELALGEGEDPRASFEQARASFQAAIARNRDLAVAHAELGRLWRRTGELEVAEGRDASLHWQEGLGALHRALRIDPSNAATRVELALTLIERSARLLEAGRSPSAELKAAAAQLDTAQATDPFLQPALLARGRLGLVQAAAAGDKASRLAALELAQTALEAAHRADPRAVETMALLAETWAGRAEAGWPAADAISHGLDWAARALAEAAGDARTLAVQGRLLTLRASLEPPGEPRRRAVALALAALEEAQAHNRFLARELQMPLQRARQLAR